MKAKDIIYKKLLYAFCWQQQMKVEVIFQHKLFYLNESESDFQVSVFLKGSIYKLVCIWMGGADESETVNFARSEAATRLLPSC